MLFRMHVASQTKNEKSAWGTSLSWVDRDQRVPAGVQLSSKYPWRAVVISLPTARR